MLLDILRCTAALLVVLAHWRILLFKDYSTLLAPSSGVKLLYFLTGIGRPSVMIFFVLSGYLITGSALRATQLGRWSIPSYLNQRITRLVVVLLPALLLCWLWDSLGLYFFSRGFYDGSIKTIALLPGVAARHGIGILLQNLFFLQGITSTTYGSNDPLWSLSYEFWYYVFLIPVQYIYSSKQLRVLLLGGSCLLLGLVFVGKQISLYFVIWLLGAAVALVVRIPLKLSERVNRLSVVVSAPVLCAALLTMRANRLPSGFAGDVVLGVACALFVWSAARDRAMLEPNLITRASKSMAAWSYSLYLVHMPFLVFVASFAIRGSRWNPDVEHNLVAFLILIAVLLYAYVASLGTERHTNLVRQWVAARLGF